MTGGALNPARAFGPSVALRTFHDYHWIYWVGPYLGGAVAAGFYGINKALRFENVNPGQDSDGEMSAEESVAKVLDERGIGGSSGDSHGNDADHHQGTANERRPSTGQQHSSEHRSLHREQQQQQQQQYHQSDNPYRAYPADNRGTNEPQYALGRVVSGRGPVNTGISEKYNDPNRMV